MKRLMLMAGVGLLLGLGAGLAGRWATRPEPVVVHDSTAATALVDQPDSVHAEPDSIVPAASAPLGDVLTDMLPVAAAGAPAAEPEPQPEASVSLPTSNPQLAMAVPVLKSGVQGPDAARRLARIFGAMRPAEAAAVLQQMDDADIREILFGMTERTAGAILGHLPPERAAALSRAALRRPTS